MFLVLANPAHIERAWKAHWRHTGFPKYLISILSFPSKRPFLIKKRGEGGLIKTLTQAAMHKYFIGLHDRECKKMDFIFPLLAQEQCPLLPPSLLPSPGPGGFPFELCVDFVPVTATPNSLYRWVTGAFLLVLRESICGREGLQNYARLHLLSMSEQAQGLLTTRVRGPVLPYPLPASVLPNWKAKLLPIAWHVGTWEGLGIGRPGFTFGVCHLWVMWSGDKSLILYAGAFVWTQCVNRINVCNLSETMSSFDHTPFFLNGCLCISFLKERVWLLQLWFWFQRWCQMRWFSLL